MISTIIHVNILLFGIYLKLMKLVDSVPFANEEQLIRTMAHKTQCLE